VRRKMRKLRKNACMAIYIYIYIYAYI